MIHEHAAVVQPGLRPADSGAATPPPVSELVAASSDLPSNGEHTGQPAGAWLTEAKPEEDMLSLAVLARSAKH